MPKITTYLILLLLLGDNFIGNGQKTVSYTDLKFESIFAYVAAEPTNMYCLLGSGFFRTPRSDDSDALVDKWLKQNPDAKVVIVSTLVEENSNLHYIWLFDSNGKTINEYLVENGCFPGGTMIGPKTYDQMTEREKELWVDSKPNIKVYVDQQTYDAFLEKIKKAEMSAKNNKLGIWK